MEKQKSKDSPNSLVFLNSSPNAVTWREDSETGEVLPVKRYQDYIKEDDEEVLEEKKMKTSTILTKYKTPELRSGLVVYSSAMHIYLKLEKQVQGQDSPV